jgi:hypothetical protein
MKKINIIDRIVLENLVLKTNLNLQPIKVLDKYIVHEGTVQKETSPNEQRPIYLYFDYDFYLDMLIEVAKHKNKKELTFSTVITGNFIQIGKQGLCNSGIVMSDNEVIFDSKETKKNN